MQWIVTDPRGPEEIVAHHGAECRRLLGGRDWRDLVEPVADSRPARRLDVYAESVVARLEEALADTYEAVQRVLGEPPFRALTRRYLTALPPHHYDLSRAGDGLPEHLARDPLCDELPFLPDLARLERAVRVAFHAEPAPALGPADLAGLQPERLARAGLVLQDHVEGLRSRWPQRSLRDLRDVADAEVSLRVVDNPEDAIVYRAGLDVVVRAPEPGELACLEALRAGQPLERALADAVADGADASGVQAIFAGWAASGLVVRVVDARD